MKTSLTRTFALLAAGVIAATAFGQIDEGAKQILEDSAEAIQQVESVSYQSKRSYSGGGLDGLLDLSGEVKMLRPEGVAMPSMWVHGSIGLKNQAPEKFTVATDGQSVYWLDESTNTRYQRRKTDRQARQQETKTTQVVFDAFVSPNPYEDALKSETLRETGVEEVDGVRCHVIEGVTDDENRTIKHVFYIGMVDLLPRREATINIDKKKNMEVAQIIEVSNLTVNGGLKPEDVALEVPLGWVANDPPPVAAPNDRSLPQQQAQPAPEIGLAAGTPAPNFTLSTVGGEEKQLSDYQGVVILAFWGPVFTRSEACLNMFQELNSFFEGEEISFVGIACRENPGATTADFVKQRTFSFDVLTNGDDTAGKYRILGFPSVVVVNKAGNVVKTFLGCPSEDDLLAAVEEAAE